MPTPSNVEAADHASTAMMLDSAKAAPAPAVAVLEKNWEIQTTASDEDTDDTDTTGEPTADQEENSELAQPPGYDDDAEPFVESPSTEEHHLGDLNNSQRGADSLGEDNDDEVDDQEFDIDDEDEQDEAVDGATRGTDEEKETQEPVGQDEEEADHYDEDQPSNFNAVDKDQAKVTTAALEAFEVLKFYEILD